VLYVILSRLLRRGDKPGEAHTEAEVVA
jgi:hypothetical protein